MYHVFVQLPCITEYLFGSYVKKGVAKKLATERYNFHNHYADVTIRDDAGNLLYKHWANEKEKADE
jgi:hypothetical protein